MNSQDKQFLKYIPVSGEKHVGLAVVRWLGKIILRFKVLPSQTGSGYWISAGSTKIGIRHDGKDHYEQWFDIDSNYEKEEMKDFVLYHVENEIKKISATQGNSGFSQQSNMATGTQDSMSVFNEELPF